MKRHLKRLNALKTKSSAAVDAFLKTEQDLEKHNTQLEQTMADINRDIDALRDLHAEAFDRYDSNQNVLSNIRKLLGKE